MTDRSLIIDELQKLQRVLETNADMRRGDRRKTLLLFINACSSALEILKEQEPRMLTLEELEKIYTAKKTHVWPFNSPPYMWITVNPAVPLTTGYWICWGDIRDCLENNHLAYRPENYGEVWMIWTKEPTDEQRKAVKWNNRQEECLNPNDRNKACSD